MEPLFLRWKRESHYTLNCIRKNFFYFPTTLIKKEAFLRISATMFQSGRRETGTKKTWTNGNDALAAPEAFVFLLFEFLSRSGNLFLVFFLSADEERRLLLTIIANLMPAKPTTTKHAYKLNRWKHLYSSFISPAVGWLDIFFFMSLMDSNFICLLNNRKKKRLQYRSVMNNARRQCSLYMSWTEIGTNDTQTDTHFIDHHPQNQHVYRSIFRQNCH